VIKVDGSNKLSSPGNPTLIWRLLNNKYNWLYH
jgi:hypothetical protein